MNSITHALIGWTVAQRTSQSRRDMAILTAASVLPDADGAGILLDLWNHGAAGGAEWYTEYHHVLGHNVLAGCIITCLAVLVARKKAFTGIMTFLLFHLHLLADILGSRGPEGDLWPVYYFYPFQRSFAIQWSGQWEVNALPNILVTVILLFWAFKLARDLGFSPIWYVSKKADAAFVDTLRHRFPLKRGP